MKTLISFFFLINSCNSLCFKSPIIFQKNTTTHYSQKSLIFDCIKFPIFDDIKNCKKFKLIKYIKKNYKQICFNALILATTFKNLSYDLKKTIFKLNIVYLLKNFQQNKLFFMIYYKLYFSQKNCKLCIDRINFNYYPIYLI